MNAPKPDFAPVRFSTEDLPERDRLPVWLDLYGPRFFSLDFEPAPDASFHADVTVRSAPGLDLVSSVVSPMRLSRTPTLLADGNDDVALLVSSSAGAAFQRGRELRYGVGEAVALSVAEAGATFSPSAAQHLCIRIRRAALAPLVTNLDDAVALRPIPPDNDALQYLLSYVRLLQEDRTLANAGLAQIAAVHLHDLAALMLGATGDAAALVKDRGLRAARLTAIKADIANHLDQPGFTVAAVAARHGITPRYVQLLFESEGTTFSQFVLDQRLARVHRMLTDPRFACHSISALALEAGFGDISYFNRAFRRRYGATPSEVREMALRRNRT